MSATTMPAAVAAAGRAAAAPYRSPLLAHLRLYRVAVVALTLAATGLGLAAVDVERGVTQAVGVGSAAAMVSAERVRTGLAEGHAAFLSALARHEGEGGASAAVARQRVGEVMAGLSDAARHVGYGAEQSNPIDTTLRGLARYETDVGRALAGGTGSVEAAADADRTMQWTLLPAAATLARVDAAHLSSTYEGAVGFGLLGVLAFVAAAGAGAFLVVAQVEVRGRTRRSVSPLLLAATLCLGLGGTGAVVGAVGADHELGVAKDDAFDSVATLWGARATGANALAAATSATLPQTAVARQAIEATYAARANTVVSQPRTSPKDGRRRRYGYLGAELENVTFPGEGEAAAVALSTWQDFDARERAVLEAAGRGDLAGAVALQTAGPGSGEALFGVFERAVARVTAINDAAFARAVASSGASETVAMGLVALSGLLAAALSWLGFRTRIAEYRA